MFSIAYVKSEMAMEDVRKELTDFFGHFSHLFITKIMCITGYLSSDVRMVDYFAPVVKTIDEIEPSGKSI